MVKTEAFVRQDGSTDTAYKLDEVETEFVPEFSKPRLNSKGKFPNYSLAVKIKGIEEVVYLTLTKGQATSKVFEEQDVKGKTLVSYTYKHPKYTGTFIGIKLKK